MATWTGTSRCLFELVLNSLPSRSTLRYGSNQNGKVTQNRRIVVFSITDETEAQTYTQRRNGLDYTARGTKIEVFFTTNAPTASQGAFTLNHSSILYR